MDSLLRAFSLAKNGADSRNDNVSTGGVQIELKLALKNVRDGFIAKKGQAELHLSNLRRIGEAKLEECAAFMSSASAQLQHHDFFSQAMKIAPPPMLASVTSSILHKFTMDDIPESKHCFDVALSIEKVSETINGVPVYALGNSKNEFILVSDNEGVKSLGLFCFRRDDAEALLAQLKDKEPSLGRGARVVEVTLDKVIRLRTEGIAFRFLPEAKQVHFAIEERRKKGDPKNAFSGVPVFQSDNLILKMKNRRFCPVFFRKEDLESALSKAFTKQKRTKGNALLSAAVQVGSLEDILRRMEASAEDSSWTDIVFIPPGIDARSYLERSVKDEPKKSKKVVA